MRVLRLAAQADVRVNEYSAKKAVAKGAALLDKKLPGWHTRIDFDELALDDQRNCILGQLFDEPQTVTFVNKSGKTVTACDANYALGALVLFGAEKIDARVCSDMLVVERSKPMINHGFEASNVAGSLDATAEYENLDKLWLKAAKERCNA